jgi:hypothetical protein
MDFPQHGEVFYFYGQALIRGIKIKGKLLGSLACSVVFSYSDLNVKSGS